MAGCAVVEDQGAEQLGLTQGGGVVRNGDGKKVHQVGKFSAENHEVDGVLLR